MEKEMGTLLGRGSLLLGALSAQQKLNKKILAGLVLPEKPLRDAQPRTLKWQVVRYKQRSKAVTAFCHYFPLHSRWVFFLNGMTRRAG
jgi:hypothetical protein